MPDCTCVLSCRYEGITQKLKVRNIKLSIALERATDVRPRLSLHYAGNIQHEIDNLRCSAVYVRVCAAQWNLPIRGMPAGKNRPQTPNLPPPRMPEVTSRKPAMARSADMDA